MPPVGFEPTISAGEQPQTHALDGAATGIGWLEKLSNFIPENRMGSANALWHTAEVIFVMVEGTFRNYSLKMNVKKKQWE